VSLFKSIQQGCSLSPPLYVIVIEALGYLIYDKVGQGMIKGIPGTELSTEQMVQGI
jgi:hypothetical protein